MSTRTRQFLVPKGVYLLSHSVGCLPRSALAGNRKYLQLWTTQGADAWPEWLQLIEDFRRQLAGLLNAQPSAICPQANVSSAVTKLLFSLPKRKHRSKIVLSETDFPSIGFVLTRARAEGYSVVFRRSGEPWEAVLDEHTQLACITHVTSNDSMLTDVAAACRLARQYDVITMVDATQSVGVVPIDVKRWRADVVVGSSIKWLCGGPGAGFLWVSAKLCGRLAPRDVGWFSHTSPLEFDIHDFRYAEDARRFWGGTPNVAPFAIAADSIKLLRAIGIDSIRAHNGRLTGHLVLEAQRLGLTVRTPDTFERRGGTVTIDFGKNRQALRRFTERGIRCDLRDGYGIRFSPHIYNTERDIDRVVEVTKVIAKRGR
jgi:kynureninase